MGSDEGWDLTQGVKQPRNKVLEVYWTWGLWNSEGSKSIRWIFPLKYLSCGKCRRSIKYKTIFWNKFWNFCNRENAYCIIELFEGGSSDKFSLKQSIQCKFLSATRITYTLYQLWFLYLYRATRFAWSVFVKWWSLILTDAH